MFTLSVTSDPRATAKTLQQLGVQIVHLYVNWGSVAPNPESFRRPAFKATDPNAYPASSWAAYDATVRDLTADHIVVNLSLTGKPPLWAEGLSDPKSKRTTEPQWEPNVREYGQWVTAVARRYSGHFTPPGARKPLPRVSFWSGWNEPNLGVNLAPETTHSGSAVEVAPRVYRALTAAFWNALHATGHGHDRILIGELAPIGATTNGQPGLFSSMVPFRFLRALYCVASDLNPLRGTQARLRGCPVTAAASAKFAAENPALFKASGFALHPYAFSSLPPDVPLPDAPEDAELPALPLAISLIDHLQRVYGSHTTFPIWSTEYGYLTNPPNPQFTVTPQQAAFYLNWAEYITWSNPRLQSFDQYLIEDPPSKIPFSTGLRTSTGEAKPTLAAYRMPLYLPVSTTDKGGQLLVWGQVRPAPTVKRKTGRTQNVAIQFRAQNGTSFQTVATVAIANPNGFFEKLHSFDTSGTIRTRWAYPDGQVVYSRVATVAVR
jgi:hypothetical protein